MNRRTAYLKANDSSSPDPYSILKLYNLSSSSPKPISSNKSNNPGFYISKPKFRGKLIYISRSKMTKILHSMNQSMSFFKKDFKNMKKCAIINRGLLFENLDIAIFVKSQKNKEGPLIFNVVFQAKDGKDLADFDFRFNENETNMKGKV
jgi:hypothetical protein